MKKHLEYKDDKSQKFWQIEVVENEFTVTYGKIGTGGQSKTKSFDDTDKALKEANKLVAQKTKKGYQEADNVEAVEKVEKVSNKATIDYYEELKKFDAQYGAESYAESFWIVDDEEDFFEDWLYEVSEEKVKEYSKSVQVFASADGTGARYAFWYTNGNADPNKAPIIYYGSEGEIAVVASDIKDLIKMLSFGQECMDGGFYFGMYDKDEFETEEEFFEDALEYRPNFLTFRKWMKKTLGITPVKNWKTEDNKEVNKLVKKAVKIYKKTFDKWQYQFYPDPADEEAIRKAENQKIYESTKADLLAKIDQNPTVDLYYQLSENEKLTYDFKGKIDHDKRVVYLKKGIELKPEHKESLDWLAKLSDYPMNIEYYNDLLKIHEKPEELYGDIAKIYEENEKYNYALNFYVKAILAGENGWDGAYQEYILDVCKQLKLNGIEVLEKTLKEKPNSGTYKVLYKHYFKKKNYQKASEYAVEYIDHTDMQAHNYMDMAEKFMKKDAYKEALPILKKTISRHSWDDRKMRTYNNIGLCYLRINPQDIDKALEAFMHGYKLVPKEVALHQNLFYCGNYFYKSKQYKKALEVLEFCVANFDYEKENSLKMIQELKNK